MQFRYIGVTLDMTASVPFHPFEVVDGDTGNVLSLTLQNNGEAFSLNGCTVCIVYSSSMGFAMQDETSGITFGEEAGTLSVLLNPDNYGPGNVSADVQVYSGPNRRVLLTSKRFDFRCRSTLISEEIIRANQAYPPLIAAARDAMEAAEEARAAVLAIDLPKGEMNVQADWAEQDADDDAYIKNKPAAFLPSAHAPSHASDGADAVTPAAIGAAAATHAASHAAGGADAVTPAAIGAAKKSVKTTTTLAAATWAGTAAPFTYTLSVTGVTATSAVEVLPSASITAAQLEAYQGANIVGGTQSAGSIVLRAFGDKPAVAIPVQIIVRGDL